MKNNRRNIIILFFTLVVIMMGFGMVIPVLPFYIKSFGASGSALGALMASYAISQFLFAPFWGSLSDRYGRKPILMVGVLGNTAAQLLFGFSNALWMLFAARILAGILSSATLPTAMAYIGDSTSEEERGGGMGLLGAAMGIGMVLGPGIAGWLASDSLSTPFFVAAGLSAAAFLFIWPILPESLPSDSREKTKIQGPQFLQMWKALFSPIGILLGMAFLVSFGMTNFEAVFGLFALERYGYGPQQVGVLLTVIGLVSAIAQGILTGPLTRRWGEANVINVSLVSSAIAFPLMLLAYNSITVVITICLFILTNSLLRPAVSSLTSRRATVGQGIAMGLINSFMSLGRIFGPLMAGVLFDINMNLPYLTGGLVMFIGFLISISGLAKEQIKMDQSKEKILQTVDN
jgi:DHA1 family multidrug resistance protein-like MFS transporter